MAKMTCARCKKEWQEPGFPQTTICDDCLKKEQENFMASDDFQAMVYNILTDEEIELIQDVDWNELKLIAAEYIALQLRWKLLKLKKGRE
ncbi:hypothetical protein J2S00_003075 [Caldalkalibacillus uzonensis]|uniref:Uncharacterized protein n=1 Tax=Caldalkalibacillus uzonensis TaxID=353224 RepID=A0ABU0CV16_9BACI|nr:hypothetical protein [Caldalkalibacillus uzonensis]MDQ0340270.1 hypothetical protein [Caldalkalibacillus uzonensis]